MADLLSQMTIEEKVAQMLNPVGPTANVQNILGNFTYTGLGTLYTGISGCPSNMTRWECQNYVQETIINGSRLKIPVSFIGETLTAGTAFGTIFPQPVLMGATFDVDLIRAVGTSIARQARLGGSHPSHVISLDWLHGFVMVRVVWRILSCAKGGGG